MDDSSTGSDDVLLALFADQETRTGGESWKHEDVLLPMMMLLIGLQVTSQTDLVTGDEPTALPPSGGSS